MITSRERLEAPTSEGAAFRSLDRGQVRAEPAPVCSMDDDAVRAGLGDEQVGVVVAPHARPPAELGERFAAPRLDQGRRALPERDDPLGRSRRRRGRLLRLYHLLRLAAEPSVSQAETT